MRISLVPDGVYESYRQITPELLQSKGICLLLSDLDFTLAPKRDKLLTDMLGANLSGVTALMVEPAGGARTPWQKVLHALQAPWKHLAGGIHRI